MATYETVLDDLKRRFGDQVLLSPKDIAPVIATSTAVQANLRSQKRFPIPIHEGSGRRVFVNIYDLAQYIATGDVVIDKPQDAQKQVTKVRATTNKGVDDKSWMRALETVAQFNYELIKAVEFEDLQMKLRQKDDIRKPKAERGII